MPERIVLAIDGGVASAAALEWTISRAANTDLNVRLMTIDESAMPVTESSQRLEAVRALDHAAGRFAELAPRSKIEMVLFRGKAVDVLARESVAADLVVIGSHGSSVLSGVFRVTVPLGLAPRSSLPVVIVPALLAPSEGPVVVGVDEPTSIAAQELAAREAERLDRDLVLARAWQLAPMDTMEVLGAGSVEGAIRDPNAELLATAAAALPD